jgi:hypothetical protein
MCGVTFASDPASIFRILLSSVTNTAGEPALTHLLAHCSNCAGSIHSAAVLAFDPLTAHFSSEM